MIDGALPYLRCPVCGNTLGRGGETLRCPRGHSFDIARPGYVNLTRGRTPHSGDSAEMVEARAAFLAAGHYAVIGDALSAAAAGTAGPVVDAGTGTGWYLARLLDTTGPDVTGIGLDVAKPALRRAARAHPRAAAVLADLWQPLPLVTGAAGVILNVFAPRNGPEFARVLRPDGRLLVVTPAADHLHELIAAYPMIRVDPDKASRVSDSLGGHFAAIRTATHRTRLTLTGDELRTLVGMTPSARHVDVAALPATTTEVTVAVDLTEYRPNRA